MKTILRLYLNTSKGNDPFLYRQLTSLNLKPKYDEHLHAFYLDTPLNMLFYLSFHSLVAQNMYVQIGKPFPAINEQTFPFFLEKIQFKNYIPMKRGLIENMAIKILTRQTQYPLSDRIITSFLQNYLQKQIIRKEYLQSILKSGGLNAQANMLDFYEMRQIVERKWQQQDNQRQQHHLKLISGNNKVLQIQNHQKQISHYEEKQINEIQKDKMNGELIQRQINNELASLLQFHPEMTFYVRKNQGRFLLKVNKQEMYKYGWKKKVGWAPIRQSIVASILYQTKIFQNKNQNIKIWDPFCGSGTIALVAAAMYYSLGIRSQYVSNFNWSSWSIYKPQYLQQFIKQANQKKESKERLHLICSDISYQAINYTIGNLKELQLSFDGGERREAKVDSIVRRIKATDQINEMNRGQWAVLCGDFEKIAQNVMIQGQKINIITNLPYTEARSKQHIPLNQLNSIYNRFSKMISKYSNNIANVFIVLNNDESAIKSNNHFLKISKQQWREISYFQSGGKAIGLFAWAKNEINSQFEDHVALYDEMTLTHNKIQHELEDQQIEANLVKYREKIQNIDKKNYYIPKHLLRFKKGYRRVLQKRRRRHLLRAYQIFARKRDKMIAFNEYSNKKLQIKMLKRGSIWRKRNTRILSNQVILNLQEQLKNQFEERIGQALKLSEQRDKLRQQKQQKSKQFIQGKKQKKKRIDYQRYLSRNIHLKRQADLQYSKKYKKSLKK